MKRSSVVSSALRGSVLLLPGFAWSPAGGAVGSRSRRWVPVWSPALLPSPRPVAPVPPVSSSAVAAVASRFGSLLFVSSPVFLSAVASGRCPVALSLRSFSRWPLRSAVLASLVRVLASPRVRAFVASPACRPAVRSFCVAALASLGFGVSGRFLSRFSAASAFLAVRSLPGLVPPFFCVGVSSRAVVAALSSLARCLRWLGRRSSSLVFCPPALRPLVARLASVLLPLAV